MRHLKPWSPEVSSCWSSWNLGDCLSFPLQKSEDWDSRGQGEVSLEKPTPHPQTAGRCGLVLQAHVPASPQPVLLWRLQQVGYSGGNELHSPCVFMGDFQDGLCLLMGASQALAEVWCVMGSAHAGSLPITPYPPPGPASLLGSLPVPSTPRGPALLPVWVLL